MWPTLWAVWTGESDGQPQRTFSSLSAALFHCSGGCIINDYADRDFDGKVKTQFRPFATGRISSKGKPSRWRCDRAAQFCAGVVHQPDHHSLVGRGALCYCFVRIRFGEALYPFCYRWCGAAFAWSVPYGVCRHSRRAATAKPGCCMSQPCSG